MPGLLAGGPVRASSPQGRFADGAALIDGRVLAGDRRVRQAPVPPLRRRPLAARPPRPDPASSPTACCPAPAPIGAVRLRLESDHAYVDLRGAIIVEIQTPLERRVLAGPAGARSAATGRPAGARIRPDPAQQPTGRRLMMDQAVLAGVGNVYRAEMLFRQRVDPFLPGRGLGAERFQAVWDDLSVLMRAGGAAQPHRQHIARAPRSRRAGSARGRVLRLPPRRTSPAASAAPRCVPR